jgi:lipopolysaccharide assembly outer membrane protein LptD (OstA)
MKNKKLVSAIAGAIVFFGIFIYIGIKSPSINLLGVAPPEKIIEFSKTRVVGWGDGKKLWEVEAEEIWSTKNKSRTTFEHVKDGTVYKNGRPIVKSLKARRVIHHTWSKKIEGYGRAADEEGGRRKLRAFVDIANISSNESGFKKQRFIRLEADSINYDPNSERAEAEGDVVVYEKGFEIYGGRMEIIGRNSTAKIDGGLKIKKDDTTISGKELIARFEEDKYTITGGVEIVQKDKAAIGDSATLNERTGEIRLKNNVRFLIEKGTAFVEEDVAESLRNPEAKESLKGKTLLYCSELTLSTKGKDAEATGNVIINQGEKSAKSEHAVYNGETEKIVLTGNVFVEKEGEWLKTEKVVVSVSEESFEATGKVEAEFRFKK